MLRISAFVMGCVLSIGACLANETSTSQPEQKQQMRVAALNWSAAEALISLGIVPVGVADPKGYSDWVKAPKLPEGITDLGTRGEPNLEVLHRLKPDLIITSPGLESALSSMPDTPALIQDTFRDDHNNGQAIDRSFVEIAKAVNKEAQAQRILSQREANMNRWKEQLKQHFNGNVPRVSLAQFMNTSTAAVYGTNSSIEYALSQLGIKPAITTANNAWGVVNLPLTKLAAIDDGVLIYVRPFAEEKKLFSSVLWQHLPFVQKGHFLTIEPCWAYGSALSIERIAQATTQALLSLPAQ